MCSNPFSGGGGGSASTSTSASSNATTVNVSTPVNLSVDTSDLSAAIHALSGAQQQEAEAQLAGSLANAGATVQAAKIAASGQSLYVIGGAIVAILGLGFTSGAIKLPARLRAA
jgi:hypothetical protein